MKHANSKKQKKKKKATSSKKTQSSFVATCEELEDELKSTDNTQEEKKSDCDCSNQNEMKLTKSKTTATNQQEKEMAEQKPVQTSSETEAAPALAHNNVTEADEMPVPQQQRENHRSSHRTAMGDVSLHSKTIRRNIM